MTDSAWIEAMQDETSSVFASAWKAVQISVAYAAHKSFPIYRWTLKTAFLMVTEEEVYVLRPEGFFDPDHPEKSLTSEERLYGLSKPPSAGMINYSNS
ncbi:retrovirus-related pol polyprotein from transposon TNT 1-94 [Tanacetum coccineum]